MRRQSLNPKSLMNALKRDLGIFALGDESAFLLHSKTRKTRKITMMESRGWIDECPGRRGREWLSKETNNYYGRAVSSYSTELFHHLG